MHETHKKWLAELGSEISIVYSGVVDEEAGGNMFAFGVTTEALNEWGADSLDAFIKDCRDLYASKNRVESMWFYCWYDQLASQIKVGAISQRHESLPFSCDVKLDELQVVIRGLFNSDSGLFTRGELNVWRSAI